MSVDSRTAQLALRQPIASQTEEFVFATSSLPAFKPGQFISVRVGMDAQNNSVLRSYSLASSPEESSHARLVIRIGEDGVGSRFGRPPRGMWPSEGSVAEEMVSMVADSGLRWHLRAFDRRSGEFRDFVLGRFDDASILPGEVADHETAAQDIQWNRITELELVPHPANVQHPDTIEAEYGMEGGVLKVRTRAAMAGYLLRRWNVDCTDDHSLKGGEHHL